MSLYPFITLFSSTLFLSTLIALSSSHWLMIWMALELNMISFLPLMTSSTIYQETEGAIKYLMFQALGSSMLLLGSSSPQLEPVIMFGLLVKLGVAPFHFWFPAVMNSISWPMCLLLTTWQKLIPMLTLISLFHSMSPKTTLFCASTSALIGGIGGLNQTQLRPLLAYSSIGHMGWIIAAMPMSPSISMLYLAVYILISIPIMWLAHLSHTTSTKFILSLPNAPLFLLLFTLTLMSLGGLPPLTGFFPKWLVLSTFSSILAPFILILGSLLNLFYYLNIIFSAFLVSTTTNSTPHVFYPSLTITILTTAATMTLPIFLTMN